MMKSFCFFLLFLMISAGLHAQVIRQDSTVNVVTYFWKGDTAVYQHIAQQVKVVGTDTVIQKDVRRNFQLVVVDSTARGYRVEYTPLSSSIEAAADSNFSTFFQAAMFERMKGQKVYFTLTPEGAFRQLENWKAAGRQLGRHAEEVVSAYYATHAYMDSLVPQKTVVAMMKMTLRQADGVINSYPGLNELFLWHGKTIRMDSVIQDSEPASDGAPASELSLLASADDDADARPGGYVVATKLHMALPPDQVKGLSKLVLDMFLDSEATSKVDGVMDTLTIDSVAMNQYSKSCYFGNSWPRWMSQTKWLTMSMPSVGRTEERINMNAVEMQWIALHPLQYEAEEP